MPKIDINFIRAICLIVVAGWSPEEARKEKLGNDPEFNKFKMGIKLKVPLAQLVNNLKMTNKYTIDDLALFCNFEQKETLKKLGWKPWWKIE